MRIEPVLIRALGGSAKARVPTSSPCFWRQASKPVRCQTWWTTV